MSDQETTEEESKDSQKAGSEEESKDSQKAGSEEAGSDSLADLQELEKIKQELMKEKEIATKELAEGQEEDEDLREVDYLQKLITLAVRFDHHVGMFLMPAYIDCGLKYDHKLAEAYMTQITTIEAFLRLLEKVDGVTREAVIKDCILKLRNVLKQVHKNLIKPLYKEVGLMKKKPKSESLESFKNNWNERLGELQKACDFEYQILDVKGFLVQ